VRPMTTPETRMTNETPEPSLREKPAKEEKIGFLAPASIILFIALTLAGTYYYVVTRLLGGGCSLPARRAVGK